MQEHHEVQAAGQGMTSPQDPVTVIGGGLAGCEAAWQLLRRGRRVILCEMKPERFSPAHRSPRLAELVCSNSLRSNVLENAAGLLKEEMRHLGSLIIAAADATAVPAGTALAVDREAFSRLIEQRLAAQPGLKIRRGEVTTLPVAGVMVVATGPLTSDAMADRIAELTGSRHLSFYDAISPIVVGDSIDTERVFAASRYGRGEADYLNCPMDGKAYEAFWKALTEAEETPLHPFEDVKCFEGCLPIEVIARRGIETLAHGPMKPVGLTDPRTGLQPRAVVQLRREDREGRLFNIVGFQTKMTWPEQKRIFRMIPGLEKAEFARYGSIHRNTFLNAPALLTAALQLRGRPSLFFGGQITGVEGYVESAAMGLLAGIQAARFTVGLPLAAPPPETALGALTGHLQRADRKDFQPMNVAFGLFPPLPGRTRKRERGALHARRALTALATWKASVADTLVEAPSDANPGEAAPKPAP
jgi:methylenetetrahydrofolate--tRNA-(uracil-5-)-methyltransferase